MSNKQPIDLPAVQSKDILLLDYDHSKQFAKRSLVSNWSRYDELRDEDDENGQLSAADFEQLLSASKSVGDHFTFAAEKSWLQNDPATGAGDEALDLFKLNITNLKNGIGRLPFYLRQGLPKDEFTDEEITNMDYRANYFEISVEPVVKPTKPIVPIKSAESKPPIDAILVKQLQDTRLQDQPMKKIESKPVPIKATASTKVHSPMPAASNTFKAKSNNTEDIQDWLDDILNESWNSISIEYMMK